jgi:hypothetical protein
MAIVSMVFLIQPAITVLMTASSAAVTQQHLRSAMAGGYQIAPARVMQPG